MAATLEALINEMIVEQRQSVQVIMTHQASMARIRELEKRVASLEARLYPEGSKPNR